jgi:flagellar motility protein MotE (MotC chaperone)
MRHLFKTFTFYIIIFLSFSSDFIYGQEEKKDNEKIKKSSGKVFTDEELEKYINEALEKKLKRIGRSKIIGFSKEIFKKEKEIQLKELDLKREIEKFNIIKKSFEKRIKILRGKQSKIIGCLDKQDREKGKRLKHMVDVISNMRPATAAKLLSVQENKISLQILGSLDSVKVSKIFNLMSKEISSRLQKQYINMKR